MATQCSSCGSLTPEGAAVCAACGWDGVARKFVGKPAGLDLFFRPEPSAPKPPVEETPPPAAAGAAAPVDLAPAHVPDPKPKEEPAVPAGFPSNLLNPCLKRLQGTEAGREILLNPQVQTVVAALRKPRVFLAVAAGLGVWCATTVYFVWPEKAPAAAPEAAPAAPEEYVRPVATLGATPRVVINTLDSVHPAPEPAAAPASSDDADYDDAPSKAAAKPAKLLWTFRGSVYDLLTMRSVFAAKLIFKDARGRVVAQTETDTKGRYKISIPSGSDCTLKIVHSDYAGRYVDVRDPKSLREASLEDRRILLQAAAHNLPWIGRPDGAVSRDLALISE